MAESVGEAGRLVPELELRIGGFADKAGAERMLALAQALGPEAFAALGEPAVAPALGGFSVSYDLLATLGVLSFPAGMIASYLASVVYAYLHGGDAKEDRVQVVLMRDNVRVFVFVDKGTGQAATEEQIVDLLDQVGSDDEAR